MSVKSSDYHKMIFNHYRDIITSHCRSGSNYNLRATDIPDHVLSKFKPMTISTCGNIYNVKGIRFTYKDTDIEGGLLIQPVKPHESIEFEGMFGFGPHCEGFTTDRFTYRFDHKWGNYKASEYFYTLKEPQEILEFLIWYTYHANVSVDCKTIEKVNEEMAKILECDPYEDPYSIAIPYGKLAILNNKSE